ncbi:chromosome segregation protein SMC [Botrimarina hoheduenensis]|uniref:Chromosome partition protein Smc n=1 Tax=Botrimarina hoheduenensis TaxID=2528000 RepID=A0A5C5WCG8_9BACT|nr:chromosome segregation protein SMC [Botrimarina hoheduenensis]TWT48608.1 Chromosome partition protein Smc [Botrimarina hoheduenensis]
MLKSLELAGFKSFADKTRFEFPAGVTVVVGPNGSGKSNVVDAVKWVLGSQSPKSLRGSEMTDVIFGGAGERRPLNAAEVTLTFDNPEPGEGERRWFDLDATEVRLTRRVYRSGEGEYLINGRACRLRDFRELLAGTGVGAGSYSIIEQGRVDAALQASPQERRSLFEEAAGISRYRLKKREAERRLERVEQNLKRLSDLVDEVEGRLRRVRSQAGKAQKHREQTRRLREARTELATADYARLVEEDRRLEGQQSQLQSHVAQADNEVRRLSESLASLRDPQEAELQRRRAADQVASCRERVGKATARIEDATRRRGETLPAVLRAQAELCRQRAQLQATVVDQRRDEAAAAQRAAVQEQDRLRQKLAQLASRSRRVGELRERVVARHEAAVSRLTEGQTLHATRTEELRRLGDRLAAVEQQRGRLEAEHAKIGPDEHAAALKSAIEQRDAATDRLARIEAAGREARRQRTADAEKLATLRSEQALAAANLLTDQRRLDALAEEHERLQRLNREVANLCGDDGNAVGLVADLLHVDLDFAPLVEAALGAATHHVAVESLDELMARHADRPDSLSFRICFEPVAESMTLGAIDHLDLRREQEVIGRALDFVEVEPRFEALVQKLLGRCWFVQSLPAALRLSRTVGRGLTFVTTDCEVVHARGEVSLGPTGDHHLAELRRREAEQLQGRIDLEHSKNGERETQIRALEESLSQADTALHDRDELLATERDRLSAALQQAAKLEERTKQSAVRIAELTTAIAATEQERAELADRQSRLATDPTGAGQLTLERRRTDRLVRWRSWADATHAATLAREHETAEAVTRHETLVRSLRVSPAVLVEPSDGGPREKAERAVREARDAASVAELDWLNRSAERSLAVLRLEIAQSDQRMAEQTESAARAARTQVVEAIEEIRRANAASSERLKPIDLRRQQLRLERSSLSERLRDDYGIDLQAVVQHALADPEWSAEAVDRTALRTEVESLRAALQNAGPVNAEALDELEGLENRYEQLAGQLRDLSQAKTSLVRLTTRINNDTRRVYVACFEEVRTQFRELFVQLFGGGQADLVMTQDSEDPLESGVEIVASPPGKTLRSLSLLSGGEKTMTCVALLLAMFRSKPGPFCILDEVDAALDEANVGRFAAVIREFMRSTQFVVVTHSKRTMSAADTLYGVTMQESGVSKQVSVRFEDVGEDGHIRLPHNAPAEQAPASRAA